MSDYPIIDDNNYQQFCGDRCDMHGMFQPHQQLVAGYRGAFQDSRIPLIPRDQWGDRIRTLETHKARLHEQSADAGLKIRDQDGIPYCWIFGVCRSAEHSYLQSGRSIHLSPASCGSWITGFRKRGGWGSEALDGLSRWGCCTHDEWPQDAVDRRYNTDENQEIARQRMVLEWYVINTSAANWHDQIVSCLIQGYAVAAGFDWWRHLVCLTTAETNGQAAKYSDPDYGLENSWGSSWGGGPQGGYGAITGRKRRPGGAVVVTGVRML